LDLDGDGYAEPYIATIDEASHELLRLVARIDDEAQVERTLGGEIISITPTEYFTKYSFIPAIDGGIYDIGFGTLLGPLNEAVNSGIDQLLDAGTMSNSNGGFLGRGAKIRGGVYTMAPWEWKRVDSTGDDLRKSLVPLPVREPSMVMFQLLSLIINYADRMSGATDQMVGITPGQNTPAETSRNALEQGMQMYSTIFKRCWRSMKEEFKKCHKLNGIFLPSQKRFGPGGSMIRREDYKTNPDLVAPSADPTVSSMSMRFTKAQTVRQAAYSVPGYNVAVVERRFLEAMQVEGIDQVYPGPDKAPPLPNPAAQVEQMKMKVQQLKIDHEKWEFMQDLMETRRLNNAKIQQLQAQAFNLASSAQDTQAAQKLKVFELALDALRVHNESIDTRVKALQAMQGGQGGQGDQSEQSNGSPNSGSSSPVAPGPSDSGSEGGPPPVAGGNQGPVDQGTISE
jgi:chaperonin GroES